MIKRVIETVIAIAALSIAASAQTITKSQDYSAFTTIEVGDSFNVSFRPSLEGNYMAEWTIDSILEEYVEVYVKNRTLFVNLDERAMNKDKEVKNAYKGKDAKKPVLNVIIKVPTFITLKLSENAVVDAMGTNFENNEFNLEVAGNAKVNNLSVTAKTATVKLQKNANVTMNLEANDLTVNMESNSALSLNQKTMNLNINTEDNANLTLTGSANSVVLGMRNSSKLNFSGSASALEVNSQERSELEATRFPVKDLTVKMKGNSKVYSSVTNNLTLEMDGATLEFSGNPEIKITNLNKATILHK